MLINLALTLDQVNIIMGALGNGPYVQVVSVVTEIQKQVATQMQPPTANSAGK